MFSPPLQTTEKRRNIAIDNDDDVDVSDGSDASDFDEDEDPDKIEVPGNMQPTLLSPGPT